MNNKDLIAQYVNTGLRLPDVQVAKLNDNLKKSYMRIRMTVVLNNRLSLNDYEYSIASNEDKEKYFNYLIKERNKLSERQYKATPDDVKEKYVLKLINNKIRLSQHNLITTPEKLKWEYFNTLLLSNNSFSDEEMMMMPHDLIYKYLEHVVETNKELTRMQYKGLSDELKWKYLINGTNGKHKWLDDDIFAETPKELLYKFYRAKISHGLSIEGVELRYLPDDLIQPYYNGLIESGKILSDEIYSKLGDDLKEKFIIKQNGFNFFQNKLNNTNDRLAMLYFNIKLQSGRNLRPSELERYNKIKNEQ